MKITALLLLFAISFAKASEIYVTEDGREVLRGGEKLKTIPLQAAFDRLKAGDRVVVLAGLYKGPFRIKDVGKPDLITSIEAESGAIIAGEDKPVHKGSTCLTIKESRWLSVSGFRFSGCWPFGIEVKNSEYISVSKNIITGSRSVVFASGRLTHHLLIELNHWVQDPSGDVWSSIPWGESHHGKFKYFNGALLAAKNIRGSAIVRNNFVKYAFNGVRLVGSADEELNANVEIYKNRFEFVRDNPIEPEVKATNWWLHHNIFYNCYTAFSFTEVKGGEWYVFGNVSYGTDKPGDVGGHSRGKVFKFESKGPYPEGPIFVFHNSWVSRSPLFAGGLTGDLRHWNNAIQFTRAVNYIEDASWSNRYHSDFNLSNRPFPKAALTAKQEQNSREGDAQFENPDAGWLALKSTSPAVDAGKKLSIAGWTNDRFDGASPDIGAFEGLRHRDGPSFRFKETGYTERPRIVNVRDGGKQTTFFFSLPLQDRKLAAVVVGEKGSKVREVDCRASGYQLFCDSALGTEQKFLFPRNLAGVNGRYFTTWSSLAPVDYLRPEISVGLNEDGRVTKKWLALIKDRVNQKKFSSLERRKYNFNSLEKEWLAFLRREIVRWDETRNQLHVAFKGIDYPEMVEFVLGKGGGDDGFTFGLNTIGMDLSSHYKNYGSSSLPENIGRMHRIISHEYVHLLTKRWNEKHLRYKPDSVYSRALWILYYEGLGDYYSLSPKWFTRDGMLSELAYRTLRKLTPKLERRMSQMITRDDEALLEGISSGAFRRKWGSVPVALWLRKATRGDHELLGDWVKKGPNGIIELAKLNGVSIGKSPLRTH